jgi:hypothetical protein
MDKGAWKLSQRQWLVLGQGVFDLSGFSVCHEASSITPSTRTVLFIVKRRGLLRPSFDRDVRA